MAKETQKESGSLRQPHAKDEMTGRRNNLPGREMRSDGTYISKYTGKLVITEATESHTIGSSDTRSGRDKNGSLEMADVPTTDFASDYINPHEAVPPRDHRLPQTSSRANTNYDSDEIATGTSMLSIAPSGSKRRTSSVQIGRLENYKQAVETAAKIYETLGIWLDYQRQAESRFSRIHPDSKSSGGFPQAQTEDFLTNIDKEHGKSYNRVCRGVNRYTGIMTELTDIVEGLTSASASTLTLLRDTSVDVDESSRLAAENYSGVLDTFLDIKRRLGKCQHGMNAMFPEGNGPLTVLKASIVLLETDNDFRNAHDTLAKLEEWGRDQRQRLAQCVAMSDELQNPMRLQDNWYAHQLRSQHESEEST